MARHERQSRARWFRPFNTRAEAPALGIDPEWADDLDQLAELAASYVQYPPGLLPAPVPSELR